MPENNKKPDIRFKGFTDEWMLQDVGKYYDFKNGLNKSKEFFGYGVPIVNFTDVFHNRGIRAKELNGRVDLTISEIANFNVKQGDIFFTRTSETINEIGYSSVMLDSPKNTVFSGFVLRARAIEKDPMALSFKQYVFFTEVFRSEMVKKSSMTTRALTSGTAIKQMNITFPLNTDEQSKIGNYFQEVDKLISLHQRKYDKLVNLKKAMLEKMFPKNGENIPEIRFKGFTEPWEEKKYNELAEVSRGLTYKPSDISDDGVRVLRSSNINGDVFIQKDDDVFVNEKAININYTREEDILITSANGSSRLVGKHTVVKDLDKKTVHGGFMLLARTKEPYFLNASMSSTWYNKFINVYVAGGNGAIGNLRKNDLEGQNVYVPHEKEQAKIGNYFQNLNKLISLHQKELGKLKNIKKACLEKMFV